jgi:hypothetical protein
MFTKGENTIGFSHSTFNLTYSTWLVHQKEKNQQQLLKQNKTFNCKHATLCWQLDQPKTTNLIGEKLSLLLFRIIRVNYIVLLAKTCSTAYVSTKRALPDCCWKTKVEWSK